MAEQENSSSTASNTTSNGTTADAAAAGSNTSSKETQQAAPSHQDWAGLTKTLREISTALGKLATGQSQQSTESQTQQTTQQQTTQQQASSTNEETGKLSEQVSTLQKELRQSKVESALAAAFAKHGITDAGAQGLLKQAVANMNPEKIGEYVDANAKLFASARPGVQQATSNTGAGGTDGKQIGDIKQMSPEAWRSLPPEEQRRLYQASRPGANPVRTHLASLTQKK
jgi:hypothetical protein